MNEPAFKCAFIHGPLDKQRTTLTRTPPVVVVLAARYERIDDPDTGEYLGAYAYAGDAK